MIKKFRKKPIVIEAILWEGDNYTEIFEFMQKPLSVNDYSIQIETLEGTMEAHIGDWIIKGIAGEFYPCKSDIFDKTYDEVKVNKPHSSCKRVIVVYLDDSIGGGSEYQINCIFHEAKKIGLKTKVGEINNKESNNIWRNNKNGR